jgi:integrase
MPIISKNNAIKSIRKIQKKSGNGEYYTMFEVYLGTDARGKKLRYVRSSKEDLIEYIEDFYDEYYSEGNLMNSKYNRHLYFLATEAQKLLEHHLVKKNLLEVVQDYIHANSCINPISVMEAYEKYYDSINPLQTIHKKSIKHRVAPFIRWLDDNILAHEVTAQHLVDYLNTRKDWQEKTRNNVIGYVKTFMQWCAHPLRKYVEKNPFDIIEKTKLPYQEPKFISVQQAKSLFNHLLTENKDIPLIVYATLSFFCGIRIAEIERLEKKDINLDEGIIRIKQPKGWTQGRPPRLVQLPPNAIKILQDRLEFFDSLKYGCIKDSQNIRERLTRIAKKLKIKLHNNIGRHSFITYHIACYQKPEKTEMMCGTSSQMRVYHYQGLASHREGLEYFKIGL